MHDGGEVRTSSERPLHVGTYVSEEHNPLINYEQSLYLGAKGMIAESFHYAHATAVKCEALARKYIDRLIKSQIVALTVS